MRFNGPADELFPFAASSSIAEESANAQFRHDKWFATGRSFIKPIIVTLLLVVSESSFSCCRAGSKTPKGFQEPGPERLEAKGPSSTDALAITGTVARVNIEGGFFVIHGDDGSQYNPINLPDSFRKDVLKIKATVRFNHDTVKSRNENDPAYWASCRKLWLPLDFLGSSILFTNISDRLHSPSASDITAVIVKPAFSTSDCLFKQIGLMFWWSIDRLPR